MYKSKFLRSFYLTYSTLPEMQYQLLKLYIVHIILLDTSVFRTKNELCLLNTVL